MTQQQKRELAAKLLNTRGFRHLREASGPSFFGPRGTRRQLTAADFSGDRTRSFQRSAEVAAIDKEARTVELAFSSEAEVERWFGIEILSHEPGACELERLADGGPLLMDHNWRDQVGVIEKVSIDSDRRGRATVRFGRSARAEEIFQDVCDGIRRHISVGYNVETWKLVEERDGVDVYLITEWEPLEISFVSVPADTSVGVGRSLESAVATQQNTSSSELTSAQQKRENPVNIKTLRAANGDLVRAKVDETGAIVEVLEVLETAAQTRAAATAAPRIEVGDASVGSAESERARAARLLEIGRAYEASDLAEQFVRNGGTADALQAAILQRQAQNTKPLAQTASAEIGMSDSEVRQFSFLNAIRALANPTDRHAQRAAAFEFEVSAAAAQRMGKSPSGILVPQDVLTRAVSKTGQGATGGNLVATNLLSGSFIEYLYNHCVLMGLATPLTGLVGDVDIPRQSAKGNAYWVGEAENVGEGTPGFDKVSLAPKTVGAYADITRKMLLQSTPDAEGLTRLDIAKSVGQAIDLAGFYGTGGAQPTGIANISGINAVDFAGVEPSYAEIVEMESKIAAANADIGSMRYITHSLTRGALKTTQKFPGTATGTPVWEGNEVNGYGALVTNQVNHGDVFFGVFSQLMLGMWGGLELTIDPITLARSGGVRVIALQDVDLAIRHAKSFAVGRKAAP